MVLGEHDRSVKESSEIEIAVKRAIRHPDFNKPYPINNDIALLQLATPVELGSRINTACLPPQDYDVPPITSKCYITGTLDLRNRDKTRSQFLLSLEPSLTPVFFCMVIRGQCPLWLIIL